MKKVIILGLSVALLGGLAGCNSDSEESISSSSTPQQTSQTSKGQSSSQQNTDFKVSIEDAIKEYQKEYPDSDITSIDLETSFGNYFYKIEGVDDNKEYEVRVDADTKKVSKEREEELDMEDKEGVKRKEDKLNIDNLLSIEKVSEIATENVGSGKATEWSLDKDMGITYWEVKVFDGQKETEVKINAQSGDVLETETDD